MYAVGVRGRDWLVMGDIVRQDKQTLELHGLLSETFILGCGTAQGRRFSVPLFNGLLRTLRDNLAAAVPGGVAAAPTPWAREALLLANDMQPAESLDGLPASPAQIASYGALAARLQGHSEKPQVEVAALLSGMPVLADRLAAIETLGRLRVGPLQYLDDSVTPCPSVGAVRAILDQSLRSASVRYAQWAKAAFNFGADKSACMIIGGGPLFDEEGMGFDVVQARKILGITVDAELSFEPFRAEVLAKGGGIFEELYRAAEAGGFPIPVLASQVPLRVEPGALFGAAVLAGAPGIETTLNGMQNKWARAVLGCRRGPGLNWALCLAQLGWEMRLGTVMLEQAIMARARLLVLPAAHPATAVREAAMCSLAPSWWQRVGQLMVKMPGGPIRDITDVESLAGDIQAATHSAEERKKALRHYRWEVVRPVLREYDRAPFVAAAGRPIPTLGLSFGELQPEFRRWTLQELQEECGGIANYRMWAVCRMTGRWPLQVLGLGEAPLLLPRCRACGAEAVDVLHALAACGRTAELYLELAAHARAPARRGGRMLVEALFGPARAPEHIRYVGRALRTCAPERPAELEGGRPLP